MVYRTMTISCPIKDKIDSIRLSGVVGSGEFLLLMLKCESFSTDYL